MRTSRTVFLFSLLGPAVIACSSGADAPGSAPTNVPAAARLDAGETGEAGPTVAPRTGGISTPDETPGTRLTPLYQQTSGSDGSVILTRRSWYDTQRGEACSFQKLVDGKTHCAPYGEEPALNRDSNFQDAACSMPVIGFASSTSDMGQRCSEPSLSGKRYVRIGSSRQCGAAHLAAFPTTGRLAITTVYRKLPNGTCQVQALENEPYEIFAAPTPLEELDPDVFVAMTAVDDTPTTNQRLRISRTVYTGADGSKSIEQPRLFDAERNELCWLQTDNYGSHRCMPQAGTLYLDFGFSSSSCTDRAISIANNASCIDDGRYAFARYMSRVDDGACRRTEILPKVTSYPINTIYNGTPTSCTSSPVSTGDDAGYLYYQSQTLPPAIPPTAFARIDHVEPDAPAGYYGIAGSRLAIRQLGEASPDGSFVSLSDVLIYDRDLGSNCYPDTLQDGKTYCVGAYEYFSFEASSGFFADSACTNAVAGVGKRDTACAPDVLDIHAKFLAARPYSLNGCETTRLYEKPSPLGATTLFTRSPNGSCVNSGMRGSDYDLYRVSALVEVPPSTFVEVTTTLIH